MFRGHCESDEGRAGRRLAGGFAPKLSYTLEAKPRFLCPSAPCQQACCLERVSESLLSDL